MRHPRFPYSAEFNGKIKYIRDFFITLFFAGLGMQIPVPSITAILMGVLVAAVVLVIRPAGSRDEGTEQEPSAPGAVQR